MALSPGIPTSFVPKQPVQTTRRKMDAGNNIFLIVSLAIFGLSVLAAGAVFGYGQFLSHEETAKAAEVQKEQDSVDAKTVQDYIRLQNRFASGETLLDNHVVLSNFFAELEKVTLQDVQFSDLSLAVAGDGSAKITLQGVAKNFNALAVQSNAIAADSAFKEAIFSGIGFGNAGQIRFTLTANLDPALIHVTKKQAQGLPTVQATLPSAPQAPAATTTKSASTTTP